MRWTGIEGVPPCLSNLKEKGAFFYDDVIDLVYYFRDASILMHQKEDSQ